jgi:hypothetical protein
MFGANFYEKAQFVKGNVVTAPGLTQLLCPSRYASITLGELTLSLVARCIMGSVFVQATKEVLRPVTKMIRPLKALKAPLLMLARRLRWFVRLALEKLLTLARMPPPQRLCSIWG